MGGGAGEGLDGVVRMGGWGEGEGGGVWVFWGGDDDWLEEYVGNELIRGEVV